MTFIEHTIHWTKGEIFEGTVIGLFGALTVLIGLAFSKIGHTPGAKAMFIPMLVLGLLFTAIGISMYQSNQKRIPQFTEAYDKNPAAFVEAEKKRVEGFQYMYTVTLFLAPICFALAAAFHWLSLNPHLRAAGIALALLGVSGLGIDFFSKERADIYYVAIQAEIEQAPDTSRSRSTNENSAKQAL